MEYLNLDSINNIIQNFENPSLSEKNSENFSNPDTVPIDFSLVEDKDLLKKLESEAEAYITVKETVGNKIYSLELDELKKPSDLKGGTLKERYHIPEGYNKLLQKIKKASELLKNSENFSNPDTVPIDFSLVEDKDLLKKLESEIEIG